MTTDLLGRARAGDGEALPMAAVAAGEWRLLQKPSFSDSSPLLGVKWPK